MRISKSDYILSLKCPLALWLKKHRADLTPEFNEKNLNQGNEIGNGGDASSQYLAFMQGLVEQSEDLFKNLSIYCGQDTLAMVKLLDVLDNHI